MKTTITTALLLAASTAYAGNPVTEGLEDPHVLIPPVAAVNWGGAYVGLSYGRTTTETAGPDEYVRQCIPGKTHRSKKCSFGGHEDSPEIAMVERRSGPWGVDGYRVGESHEPVVYDEGNALMWVSEPFTYTTTNADEPTHIPGKDAQNVLVDVISSVLTDDENHLGGFVGYRHDFGSIVAGVEASFADETTYDAHIGFEIGQALAYVATDGTYFAVGADLLVTSNLLAGVKVSEDTAQVRLGWMF